MSALKLLSRSTNLKGKSLNQNGRQLPSEGQTIPPELQGLNRKRKRDDDAATTSTDLSTDSIRQVQKGHRIRIINLRKLHKDDSMSRKQQKESARIFPQPLLTFEQLRSRHGIHTSLASNVREQGYYEPTEVQIAALPVLLESTSKKADLLTVAPTGSGKTLAFLLPAIQMCGINHHLPSDDAERHPQVLVLAPTKELVTQIVNEGRKLCTTTGVSITAMRKGMRLVCVQGTSNVAGSDGESSGGEEPSLSHVDTPGHVKSDILVSTPLSLVHALSDPDSASLFPLPHLKHLVLDEADVLLDPLFRSQTLAVWSACTSPDLRVSLWSATIGSSIEELAVQTISDRQKALKVKKHSLLRVVVGLKDSSLPNIEHKLVYAATETGKLLGLRQLLHPARSHPPNPRATSTSTQPALRPPFLIFTQTIERASALHQELQYDIPAAAGGSSRIALLHSSLSNSARSSIMTKFRRGEIWILITTDLLSRGVDFRGINGVVNYDIPTTSAAYVHRAGRTGRAGRSGGMCVTFYTKEDVKYLKAIASVIKASHGNPSTVSDRESDLRQQTFDRWLLNALPELTKQDRKELKQRGVHTRRAIKESDDAEERKQKRKARIGTKSGYERRLEFNRRGAVEGSKKRKRQWQRQEQLEGANHSREGWAGFD